MKLKPLVGALVLAATCGAQAATYDFGVHDAVEVGANLVSPGAFADIYTFTLAATQVVSSSVSAVNVGSALNIFASTYALYSSGADSLVGTSDDSIVGSPWAFNGSSGSIIHSLSLSAGSYYYVASGIANGAAGGVYTLTSTTVPVPEPETYALLLGGLGVVGFLARRRRVD